jgi:hypothetical protein
MTRTTRFLPVLGAVSLLLAKPTWAQITISNHIAADTITFGNDGNVSLPRGLCLGNVNPMPPGKPVALFGDKAVTLNGSLFVKGSMYNDSLIFPGVQFFNNTGLIIASVNWNGDLYIRGGCTSGCVRPVWEPQKWGNEGYVQGANNCYNYGADTITMTFARPGRACGAEVVYPYSVDRVRNGVLCDGLTWAGWDYPINWSTLCGAGHLVYMTVRPNETDFHFLRQDTDGRWTHKRGDSYPEDKDHSTPGLVITGDPRLANLFPYTVSGGFYCTCGPHAHIQ